MNDICFSEVQITVLAKIRVQIQSWKCKAVIEQKYGAWQSTLGVKHALGQWKEKLRFLPRLRYSRDLNLSLAGDLVTTKRQITWLFSSQL